MMKNPFILKSLISLLLTLSFSSSHCNAQSQAKTQNTQVEEKDEITKKKEEFQAYGRKQDKSAIPLLIEGLKDKNPDIRTAATWALASIADKSTINILISSLRDSDYRVRGNSVVGLMNIGDNSAISPLTQVLKDDNKDVRTNAVAALSSFGISAVPVLIRELENERLDTKQQDYSRTRLLRGITIALANIKDKSAVPALYKLLKDQDGNVAISAAESLCNFQDEAIILDLIKFAIKEAKNFDRKKAQELSNELKNEDGFTQLTAAMSLVSTSINIFAGINNAGKPVIPILIKALRDEDYEIRFFAINLLENFCLSYPEYKETVIESFIRLLGDEYSEVRKEAKKSLEFITDIKDKTGQEFGEDQNKWRAWWEENKKMYISHSIPQNLIKADEVVNLENSLLLYKLPTRSSEDIFLYVEYTEYRPNPEIFNIDFSLAQPKQNGEYTYFLQTEQNRPLKIVFTYSNGKLFNAQVDTDFRPDTLTNADQTIFTVVSRKGYKIDFIFHWKGTELDFVQVLPRINTFMEQ